VLYVGSSIDPEPKTGRLGKVSADHVEIMVVYVEIEIGCSWRGGMTYVVPPSLPINPHINPRSRLQDLPYLPTVYFRLNAFGDEDMMYSRESCSLYVNDFQFDGVDGMRSGLGSGVDGESARVVGLSAT
jgi:hypothetical protein